MKIELPEILKGGMHLSGARLFLMGIGIAQSLILAKTLGPGGFGEVSLFTLMLTYANLIGPGFEFVASREIPGIVANKDCRELDHIINYSFTIELLVKIVVSLVIASVGILFYEGNLRIGILLVALVLICQKVSTYYQAVANSLKSFSQLSRSIMLNGLISGTLIIILAKHTGVFTRLIAFFISYLIISIYLSKKINIKVKLCLHSDKFLQILKAGIPFIILNLFYYFWITSDRIIVAKSLTIRELGLYSFAFACIQILLNFAVDFNSVLQPYIYERLHLNSDKKEIKNAITNPSIIYAYVTSIIIFALWYVYPLLTNKFMPEYAQSISVFRILLVQLYFNNIAAPMNILIRSKEINKHAYMIISYLLATIVSYVTIILLLKFNMGIVSAAIGITFSNFFAIVLNFHIAWKHFLKDRRELTSYLYKLIKPLLYVALSICFIALAKNKEIAIYAILAVSFFVSLLFIELGKHIGPLIKST